MAKNSNKVSGRQACIAAIQAAGKPLTADEISTAIVESGVVPTLKGKTPKATLAAQITAAAKKGQTFKKVGDERPARFDLIAGVDASPDDLIEALRKQLDAASAPPDPVEDVTVSEATVEEAAPAAKPDPKPTTAVKKRSSRAKQTAAA